MKGLVRGIVLTGLVLVAAPVQSHHSQTMYEESKLQTIVGAVEKFVWKNPHTWLYVDVTEQGKVTNWEIETNSAASLQRSGWKRDQYKAGDKVTVTVNPAKNGSPKGMLREVVGPDGKKFTMPGNGPQRPRTGLR
jgi:hypothetical protein